MQNADTVLKAIQKCGIQGKPLQRIYRQLFNRELYLLAYGRIYRNSGAMTPGVEGDTVDSMSLARIEAIIDLIRQERYAWTPTRRVYIEKKHSNKKRPLGIPGWRDKLVQEVIRLILEAYYEPSFSDFSHGFRRDRGCGTALSEILFKWDGTKWFIEGDIAQCFDRLEHTVLLDTLAERIHDGRFLNLIRGALKAGYLEDWKWHPTLSGSPQGGIISPILANIYLDRLDKFVQETLLPAYNRGIKRRTSTKWATLQSRESQARLGGKREKAKQLRTQMQSIPCLDPYDPDFRRLRYIRYADDFLLGFAGPHQEAEQIKQKIKGFLQDTLKLELSEQKTVITNARSDTARFLGYDVHVLHSDAKRTAGRRAVNGKPGLRVPYSVITQKCSRYMQNGKPIHRKELLNNSVYDIIRQYQHEYRGFVEYYRLAYNLCQVGRLQHVMEVSLVKTLAHKLKISVPQVYRRYEVTLQTEDGPRKTLRVTVERTVVQEGEEQGEPGKPPLVAQWGNVTLKWNKRAIIREPSPFPWDKRTQLVDRLLADTCELCGSGEDVEVHHIRHLKDLQTKGRKEKPQHIQVMAARRRKTLVVCRACHNDIHKGRSTVAPIPKMPSTPSMPKLKKNTGEPDDAKVSSPVRRGADGKVPHERTS